jgi:hypothetical protein
MEKEEIEIKNQAALLLNLKNKKKVLKKIIRKEKKIIKNKKLI